MYVRRNIEARSHNHCCSAKSICIILDFKLSPCSECFVLSSGYFHCVWILYADVSEHCLFHLHRLMKTEQIVCFKTSAYKIQTPGNCPEESIQQYVLHNLCVFFCSQHAMSIRHTVSCGLPRATTFSHIISQTALFSKNCFWTQNVMFFLML